MLFVLNLMLLALLAPSKTFAQTAEQHQNVNWKNVHVLVYTKNGEGFVHDNIGAATKAIRDLGKQHGFGVDVSDDPKMFNEQTLKKYTLIIFNNTNNNVFDTDSQKVAFMRYVQAGGGFVGLHSASGTERQWPWFKRLVGASFLRHAIHQTFNEIIIHPHHPSTAHLPKKWKRNDECYFFKDYNPDIHVLIVHDLSSLNDDGKPDYYGGTSSPSVWCHQFDGGRQWYTSLGHDAETYATKEFQKHIMGGIEWVVGKNRPLDFSKSYARTPNDPLPY